jgi:dUTP pyrophosphatase
MINLYFKPLKESAKKPVQAHESDAGWDLFATEDVFVYPHKQEKLSTGISVQAKFVDPKFAENWKIFFKIEGTSGNAARLGLQPIGGVVDQNYLGEIGVIIVNNGTDTVKIEKGKKIAQLIPMCIPKIASVHYLGEDENFETTDRGTAGFGSTGYAN